MKFESIAYNRPNHEHAVRIAFALAGLMITIACGRRAFAEKPATTRSAYPCKNVQRSDVINKTDQDWKKELTTEQYHILREKGTEQPFTRALLNERRKVAFVCGACGLQLFGSDAKFELGTGWPGLFSRWAMIGRMSCLTIVMACSGMKSRAPAAAGIWAMFSTTVPLRPGCAIA